VNIIQHVDMISEYYKEKVSGLLLCWVKKLFKKTLWKMKNNTITVKFCYHFILLFCFPIFFFLNSSKFLVAKAITQQEFHLPQIIFFTVPCLNGRPMNNNVHWT